MAKGKIKIEADLCKGCGLCLVACKFDVIKLSKQGQTNKYGYQYTEVTRPEQCTGCTLCALMCPDSAVTVWREIEKSKT